MDEERVTDGGKTSAAAQEGESRTIKMRFVRIHRSRIERLEAAPFTEPKADEYSYLAQVLALAHALECRIEGGEFDGRQALAKKLGVSAPRLAKVLDLVHLAPDIQRAILNSTASSPVGKLSLRQVRPISLIRSWAIQRARWAEIAGSARSP